ncbi:class I SAM-dependent methyltransferase [Patulibacter defluvii]|uniref:class I SAM-dependent methyltransferase n=1 Tax=Patulibacter defluvii TaxID=3095358 RepID=UPI002A755DB6|nr:class I SAM-dependent methyltransferase [Patulibacter sp. DM4]
MDVDERLSLEAVSANTLIAAEHRHRYEVAARAVVGQRVVDLCCGVGYGTAMLAEGALSVVGVDRAAAATDAGRASCERAGLDNVTFVTADALGYLRSLVSGEVDVVVCFEGLEHLPELDRVVDELARLASSGTAIVTSVPNSATLGEENDFHLTDFDLPSAEALAVRIPGAWIAYQTHAEGSLIRTAETDDVDARVRLGGEHDLDWANSFLVVAGIDQRRLLPVEDANLQLTVSPVNHRYMRHLEQANRELWATNMRLGRERLGRVARDAGDTEQRDRDPSDVTRIADLEAQLASAIRERDEHRRAWIVVRHSRLTRVAARLAGHRFDR